MFFRCSYKTFLKVLTYSGFNFLSRPTIFSTFSKFLSSNSSSLSRNSSEIVSKSLTGFTSPSTWMTSASSNARHRWKIPSHALIWERKAFPKPCPSAAPFTRPAISTTFKYAGTLLFFRKKRNNRKKKVSSHKHEYKYQASLIP